MCVLCVLCASKNIIRFVKLPNSNKKHNIAYAIMCNVKYKSRTMPFTFEEKCFIKVLRPEKEWGAKRICSEFRQKKWTVSSVNDLLRKIDKTGSVERKVGSGRPRSTRTQRNISRVNDFICSQEDNPGTSESPREIQKVTGISRAFCH